MLIPNSIFALRLEANKTYSQTVEETFKLSMASLAFTSPSESRVSVRINYQDQEFTLCNLMAGRLEQQPLELVFSEGEDITFSAVGDDAVDLVGNYMTDPIQDMQDDEMWQDSDEDNDDDAIIDDEALEQDSEVGSNDEDMEEMNDADMEDLLNLIRKRKNETAIAEDDSTSKKIKAVINDKIKAVVVSNAVVPNAAVKAVVITETVKAIAITDAATVAITTAAVLDVAAIGEAKQKPLTKKEKAKKRKQLATEALAAQNLSSTPVADDIIAEADAKKTETTAASNAPKIQKENKAEAAKKIAATATASPVAPTPKKADAKKNDAKSVAAKASPASATKDEKSTTDKKETSMIKTLPNGMIIEDVVIGSGPKAKKGKKVSARYIGKLKNGKVFDSNTKGKPFSFKVGAGEVIKGWDLGFEGMLVGGTRKLTVPAQLAYGTKGAPPDIPPNSVLEFEVKLLEVKG